EETNLSELVSSINHDLRKAHPGRVVETIASPSLSARCDTRMIRIALENLLRNAWKFSGKRPLARIEFGANRSAGETVFYIRDNGAGFDVSKASKLFGVFQRLHSQHEFNGTGIGLTIVQRIVERHGGRIWAEAAVGQGATFYFTLSPAPLPPERVTIHPLPPEPGEVQRPARSQPV